MFTPKERTFDFQVPSMTKKTSLIILLLILSQLGITDR